MTLAGNHIPTSGTLRILAMVVVATGVVSACGASPGAPSPAAPQANDTITPAWSPPPSNLEAVDTLVDAGRDEHTRVLSYLMRGTQGSGGLLSLDLTIDHISGQCNLDMPKVLDALHPSAAKPALASKEGDRLALSGRGSTLPSDSADYWKSSTWHFGSETYSGSFEGWVSLETPPLTNGGWCKAQITGEATLNGSAPNGQVKVPLPSLLLDTRDALDGTVDNGGWEAQLGIFPPMKMPYGKPMKLPPLPGTVLGTYSGMEGYAQSYLPGRKASDAQWIAGLKKVQDAYNAEWNKETRELPPTDVCYFHAVAASADAYGDAGAYMSALVSQAEAGNVAAVKKKALEFAKDPSVALTIDVGGEVADAKAACKSAHAQP
jgi:hypothetical protein